MEVYVGPWIKSIAKQTTAKCKAAMYARDRVKALI